MEVDASAKPGFRQELEHRTGEQQIVARELLLREPLECRADTET